MPWVNSLYGPELENTDSIQSVSAVQYQPSLHVCSLSPFSSSYKNAPHSPKKTFLFDNVGLNTHGYKDIDLIKHFSLSQV